MASRRRRWPATGISGAGPEQDGVSREKNLPEKWSPDGENVVWNNDVGGMSSPIVMNGYLYTFTRVGEVPAGDEASPTLDPGPEDAGSADLRRRQDRQDRLAAPREHVRDRRPVPPPRLVEPGRRSGDRPRLRPGRQNDAGLLDGKTGKVIWKHQMIEEFGMITTFGGRTPSPAIDEDQLFIAGVSFGWGEQLPLDSTASLPSTRTPAN